MKTDFNFDDTNYRLKQLENGNYEVLQSDFIDIKNGEPQFTDWNLIATIDVKALKILWSSKGMNYTEITKELFGNIYNKKWKLISAIIDYEFY